MKLEEYVAGVYKQGDGYKAFLPNNINFNWGWMIQNLIHY